MANLSKEELRKLVLEAHRKEREKRNKIENGDQGAKSRRAYSSALTSAASADKASEERRISEAKAKVYKKDKQGTSLAPDPRKPSGHFTDTDPITWLQREAPYVAREVMGGTNTPMEAAGIKAPEWLRLLQVRGVQSFSPFLQTGSADEAIVDRDDTRRGVEQLESGLGETGAAAAQFAAQSIPSMVAEGAAGLNAAVKAGAGLGTRMWAGAREGGVLGGMGGLFSSEEGERVVGTAQGVGLGGGMGAAGGAAGGKAKPKKPKKVGVSDVELTGPALDLVDTFDYGQADRIEDARVRGEAQKLKGKKWEPGDPDLVGVLSPEQYVDKQVHFDKLIAGKDKLSPEHYDAEAQQYVELAAKGKNPTVSMKAVKPDVHQAGTVEAPVWGGGKPTKEFEPQIKSEFPTFAEMFDELSNHNNSIAAKHQASIDLMGSNPGKLLSQIMPEEKLKAEHEASLITQWEQSKKSFNPKYFKHPYAKKIYDHVPNWDDLDPEQKFAEINKINHDLGYPSWTSWVEEFILDEKYNGKSKHHPNYNYGLSPNELELKAELEQLRQENEDLKNGPNNLPETDVPPEFDATLDMRADQQALDGTLDMHQRRREDAQWDTTIDMQNLRKNVLDFEGDMSILGAGPQTKETMLKNQFDDYSDPTHDQILRNEESMFGLEGLLKEIQGEKARPTHREFNAFSPEGDPMVRSGGDTDLTDYRPHGLYWMPGLQNNPAFDGAPVQYQAKSNFKNPLEIKNTDTAHWRAGQDPIGPWTAGAQAMQALLPKDISKVLLDRDNMPIDKLRSMVQELFGWTKMPDAAWTGHGPAYEMIGARLAQEAGHDAIVMYGQDGYGHNAKWRAGEVVTLDPQAYDLRDKNVKRTIPETRVAEHFASPDTERAPTLPETQFDHNKRGLDGPGASSKGDVQIQEKVAQLDEKMLGDARAILVGKEKILPAHVAEVQQKLNIGKNFARKLVNEVLIENGQPPLPEPVKKAQTPGKKTTTDLALEEDQLRITANLKKAAELEAILKAAAAGQVDPTVDPKAKEAVDHALTVSKTLDTSGPPNIPPTGGPPGSPPGSMPAPMLPGSMQQLRDWARKVTNQFSDPGWAKQMDKIFRKEEFRAPEDQAEVIRNVKSMHVVENMRMNQLMPRLRAAWRKAGPEGQRLLKHYFMQQDDASLEKKFRKINFEELPEEFRQLTEESERYVSGMMDELKAGGYIDEATEARMQKMKEDGRKWFHRSYYAYLDPSFKYDKDLYSKTLDWFRTNAKDSMKEEQVIQLLFELKNGDPSRGLEGNWSDAIAKSDVLKHKQNLPPIVRELLGQVHDPSFVVASSHAEVERLWHHMRATQAMVTPETMGKVWGDQMAPGMFPVPIPNSKKKFGEFAGKYVPPELFEALIEGNGHQVDQVISLLGGTFSKIFKTSAIALNHVAYMNQAISNFGFLAGAGLPAWNAKLAPSLFNAARSIVSFYSKAFRPEGGPGRYMQMAIEDGAIIPGTGADFGGASAVAHAKNLLSMERKGLRGYLEAPVRGGRTALNKLGNAYDLLDHVPRLAAYTYQLEKGLKRGLPLKQARARAAMIVQRNFASAGNSTDAVKRAFKTHGYVNEFGGFWVDNIRVHLDMMQDSRNWQGLGSPFGGEGLARSYNVIMQRLMFSALATYMVKKYAFSDAEMEEAEKSMRTGFRSFNPTRSWMPFRDSKGRMQAVSWSNADPMATFLKGKPEDGLLTNVALNLGTGWMGNSTADAAKAGMARFGMGTSPYRPDPIEGTGGEEFKEFLWQTFMPRSIVKVENSYRRYQNEKGKMRPGEEPYTLAQAIYNATNPMTIEPVGPKSKKQEKRAIKGEIKGTVQDKKDAKKTRKYTAEELAEIKAAVKNKVKHLKKSYKERGK